MKGKLLRKLIAVALVLCMTATNFIFVAASTVYALSATAELEGGNVVFEAYFKSEDKKVTEKTANISQGEKLYLSLELKAGKLQDGKVKINNANFKIIENAVNSKFINHINAQTNEIFLNEISYNDSKQGAIELEIPIQFEEADKVNTAYFEMQNNIIFSGKYFNSSEIGKNIQSNPISTKLIWSESNVSVGWNANIEKVIYLENKALVQTVIKSTYKDTYFPKEYEKITISIPKVNNITPTYTILADGDKVDINKISNSVTEQTISFTNELKNGENIVWNKSGNTYKVIYVYDGITRLEDPLQLKASIETKLLQRDKMVSKELNFNSNVPQGTIASVDAKSISGEVYKGYMYANSNETVYEEEYNMELSSVKDLKSTLELQEDNFKTENGNISTNDKTQYKEIKINKAKLVSILGKNGKLEINPNNSSSSIIIDANTSADESGNIVIKENQILGSHNVVFNVISAENEGTLKITVKKAIIGNAGYNKETLKTINAVETTVKSYTNNVDRVSNAVAVTPLKETVTNATIEMNNNNILSTTNINNIEFVATIKTGTMDTDLLKAPTIKIILPDEVEKIELTSNSSALYVGQELKVESTEVVDNGKAILVKLDGEQFKYDNKLMESIKITVYANITLNKSAVSRENAEVLMEYTNENSADKKYTASTKVTIQAPYGLMTEAELNSSFETVNKGIEILKARITNNYEKPIEEISLIGIMPDVKKSKDEFEQYLKENLRATLNEINVEIKYSQDGENFDDNFENAKNYKITFKNTKFATGEKLTIAHQIEVSKISSEFKLAYLYEGIEKVQNLKIDRMTSNIKEEPEEKPEIVGKDKLVVGMIAKTQKGEVTEDTTLLQNQTIRYTYQIKNNSNENIDNVDLKVKHENANIFEEKTEQQVNTAKPDEQLNFTFEVETDKSEKEFAIGTLKAGETRVITYQVRIKEDAKTLKTTVELSAKDVETVKVEKQNKVEVAPVKLEITNNVAKEYPIEAGKIFANTFTIKNTSNEALKNITINFSIPKEYEYYEIYELTDNVNYKLLQADKNYLVFSINELAPGVTKELNVVLKVVDEKPQVEVSKFNYTATIGKDTYSSNDVEIPIKEFIKSNLQVNMTSNIEGIVKTGDKLIYKTQIKNIGNNSDSITFLDFVPEAAPIKNAYYTIGNEQTKIENVNDNTILETISLKAGEEANVYIETQIDESLTGKEEITNSATIAGNFLSDLIKTEEITNKLQANIKEDEEKIDPSEGDKEEQPKDVVDSEIDVKQSISGLVWVDANKNGIRESSEKTLEGITVTLGNVETGKYVTDNDGNKLEVKTNEKGEYKFENISNGKYIVVFKYDNVKYRNTEYKANGIAENVNSDIITSKISTDNEDVKYGITDTLELKESSLENIDAGLIENEVFDLTLNKYITKVTVQNSSGTITKQYSKEQLAKIEIDAKNLAASTVLVEYTIEVKNEGEIAGYANEIVDYIPKDLSFSSQINKDWYISTDGNLHTTALAKELINPGETKTITLTLVKTMTENNTGLTTNKAEIVKSSNELSIPDRDSKAGNNVQNEDDMSTAELIISIRTGIEFTIGIITVILAITTAGIVIYTKKRKEANHE